MHKIVHFACEGDFSVFQNHAYSTLFKATLFILARKCTKHMIASVSREIGWLEQCTIRMNLKHTKNSFKQSQLFYTTNRNFLEIYFAQKPMQGHPEISTENF